MYVFADPIVMSLFGLAIGGLSAAAVVACVRRQALARSSAFLALAPVWRQNGQARIAAQRLAYGRV